jgi:hypothetical protein
MRPHNRKMKEFVAVLKREWWRRETHRLIIQSMRFMFPELDVLWSAAVGDICKNGHHSGSKTEI